MVVQLSGTYCLFCDNYVGAHKAADSFDKHFQCKRTPTLTEGAIEYWEYEQMATWIWIAVTAFAGLILVVGILRLVRPPKFEPVELDFDLRAVKSHDPVAADALKLARTRELAKRHYSLHKRK